MNQAEFWKLLLAHHYETGRVILARMAADARLKRKLGIRDEEEEEDWTAERDGPDGAQGRVRCRAPPRVTTPPHQPKAKRNRSGTVNTDPQFNPEAFGVRRITSQERQAQLDAEQRALYERQRKAREGAAAAVNATAEKKARAEAEREILAAERELVQFEQAARFRYLQGGGSEGEWAKTWPHVKADYLQKVSMGEVPTLAEQEYQRQKARYPKIF
ncbi:MAG: hypothetical protein HYX51_10330 [Chloroflexi bacterium]|nr:hypothetical protein [Chloroflexota bacterium]